jgi:hypothetical protein
MMHGMQNRVFGLMVRLSLILLLISILVSRWGRIAVSTHGITALNEQWMIEGIAHRVPPPFTHGYTAWQVMPGVYRIDWSEWHSGCMYLDFPSWTAFALAGVFPALWVVKLAGFRKRDRDASLATLKAKLRRGSAQADQGDLVGPDAVSQKIKALKRRRAAAKS